MNSVKIFIKKYCLLISILLFVSLILIFNGCDSKTSVAPTSEVACEIAVKHWVKTYGPLFDVNLFAVISLKDSVWTIYSEPLPNPNTNSVWGKVLAWAKIRESDGIVIDSGIEETD